MVVWLLIRAARLPGAAGAWLLRVIEDCIVMLWFSAAMRGALLRGLPGVGLMLLCFLLAWGLAPGTALALGLGIALGLLFPDCGLVLEPAVREAVHAVAVAAARIPRHEIVQ